MEGGGNREIGMLSEHGMQIRHCNTVQEGTNTRTLHNARSYLVRVPKQVT